MEDKSIAIPKKGFSDFSTFKLLDKVLHILTVPASGGRTIRENVTIITIYHSLENDLGVSLHNEEFKAIIDKLTKDGYIKEVVINNGTPQAHCLTFDGFVFFQQGGYQQQVDILESQIRQSKNNHRLTVAVAVGAGVASAYYIIESIRIFFPSWFPK